MTIRVRVEGVGLLEFHQIDAGARGREASRGGRARGRACVAARAAMRAGLSDLSGRRTVVRV